MKQLIIGSILSMFVFSSIGNANDKEIDSFVLDNNVEVLYSLQAKDVEWLKKDAMVKIVKSFSTGSDRSTYIGAGVDVLSMNMNNVGTSVYMGVNIHF